LGAIAVFVGDGAERAGAIAAGFTFMWCAAHLLNLVIQHTFNTEGSEFKSFVDRCASVVTHFHSSPLATYRLEEHLGDEDVESLKNRAETRWNSIFAMFRSLAANAAAIKAYYRQRGNEVPCPLDGADWLILPDLINLLEPLSVLTTAMSAVKYPTAVLLLPRLYSLPAKLEDLTLVTEFAKRCRVKLVQEMWISLLDNRFYDVKRLALFWAVRPGGYILVSKWYTLVVKSHALPGVVDSAAFMKLMSQELVNCIERHGFELPPVARSVAVPDTTGRFDLSDLDGAKDVTTDPSLRTVIQEVRAWELASANMTAHPPTEEYWSDNGHIAAYPRVAQASGYALSQGLTAVACENLFSAAGFISNGRRNRIGSKRLDMQLFEHWNRRLGAAQRVRK
jgi:hypothetical protein